MDLADLVALETTVWDALQRGDRASDEALLAPGFLGVYPSGFAGRDDHTGQLEAGPTVASFEILDARMIEFTPDHALLAYRATYQRPDRAESEEMFVSSVWSRTEEGWTNVFSQDTPVDLDAELP